MRQRLIGQMIQHLGYPMSYLALEKELRHMPHLKLADQNIPERRADVICFAKDIHPQHALYPLLLIECKAVELTPRVINQVVGYNHFVKAYFIAVVNQAKCQVGWFDATEKMYRYVDYLPTYASLLAKISHHQ